jgi:hypothetical protein
MLETNSRASFQQQIERRIPGPVGLDIAAARGMMDF